MIQYNNSSTLFQEYKRWLKCICHDDIKVEPRSTFFDDIAHRIVDKWRINIKFGIDPNHKISLHLGHLSIFYFMKRLLKLSTYFHLYIVFGTFTATIGDVSGKKNIFQRWKVDQNNTLKNAKICMIFLKKYLKDHLGQITFKFNHTWFNSMSLGNFFNILHQLPLNSILDRKNIRQNSFKEINISMALYPVLQAYDSVYLSTHIELCANDQLFNVFFGWWLQSTLKSWCKQYLLALPLLIGLDGVRKMGKSEKNAIFLSSTPINIYIKIMRLKDTCIKWYYIAFIENVKIKDNDIWGVLAYQHKHTLAVHIINLIYDKVRISNVIDTFNWYIKGHNIHHIMYHYIDSTIWLYDYLKNNLNLSKWTIKFYITSWAISVDVTYFKYLHDVEQYVIDHKIYLKVGKVLYVIDKHESKE